MKKRLIVGLTGTFGSGKSTVGKILKRLGARKVIDTDQLAHEVFRPKHPLGRRIKALFGMKLLNRKAIAKEVFSSSKKRKKLEGIIHPYVKKRVNSELKTIRRGIVILEVPLLFESGFDRMCDVTVAVLAGESNIMKRRRPGFSRDEVRARLRAQFSELAKKRKADLYIQNSGSKSLLTQKTKRVWQKLLPILNPVRNDRYIGKPNVIKQ